MSANPTPICIANSDTPQIGWPSGLKAIVSAESGQQIGLPTCWRVVTFQSVICASPVAASPGLAPGR